MAWLQKRPQVSDPQMFYTLGLNKTILLVGLGNPGNEYQNTRHNIGFMCLDDFVSKNDQMSDWINKKDLKCTLSSGTVGDARVIAIKPTTFMNLSGEAVQSASNFYKIHPDNLLVIQDELDVDFGHIRIRNGGGSAGHNGIKSIVNVIGEDFTRIRIGIGPKHPPQIKSEDFVLQKFTGAEMDQLPNLLRESGAIISEYVYGSRLDNETRSFIV
ncbi:MAG TPA: aminoacyl-tRNA hydrolase [Candidatus Saccharimonadales bacterium]|nr:aminoacyl-tRNA hydrolase [Candidatus Saccharimonadales bacterium]